MAEHTFALTTLGCKVNQEEGVAISNLLQEQGWRQLAFTEQAEVYIINTCTVTHLADKKSRQLIRRASRQNSAALVVATGCYAQTSQQELEQIEGLHLIVGTNDRPRLLELIETALAQARPQAPVAVVSRAEDATTFQEIGNLNNDTGRKRAFLKIEDGCSQFCSYCIIPYARGPVRSKPPERVLAEAQELVGKGYLELVLTGIHTGAYGADLAAGIDLAALAARLVELPDLHRLRLGSIEPQEVSPALITLAAGNGKICPHFHIPLQAGSNTVLQAMNRHYTVEFYAALLQRIRAVLPNAAITTDVIAGFPGESPEEFQAAMAFMKQLAFADLHVFPYSPRKGTPAASYPGQVQPAAKEQRAALLRQQGAASRRAYWQKQVGAVTQVIWEQLENKQSQQVLTGHSPNYLPVATAWQPQTGPQPGQLWQVRLETLDSAWLWGQAVERLK